MRSVTACVFSLGHSITLFVAPVILVGAILNVAILKRRYAEMPDTSHALAGLLGRAPRAQ